MLKTRTQEQHFWKAHDQIAATNTHFMELVKNNDIGSDELKILIDKRPEVWERFKHWIDKLPNPVNMNPVEEAA